MHEADTLSTEADEARIGRHKDGDEENKAPWRPPVVTVVVIACTICAPTSVSPPAYAYTCFSRTTAASVHNTLTLRIKCLVHQTLNGNVQPLRSGSAAELRDNGNKKHHY